MKTNPLLSAGLMRSNLKRFWPLWLIYFTVMALLLVMPVYAGLMELSSMNLTAADEADHVKALWNLVLVAGVLCAFAAAPIIALSMEELLFRPEAATFFGSAPLSRGTLFATSLVSGALPLVAVPVLVAGVFAAIHTLFPVLALELVGQWLGLVLGASLAFYGVALLSCQVAGTRPVATVLYCVANILAVGLTGAVLLVVSVTEYGLWSGSSLPFVWASPLVGILDLGIGKTFVASGINWPAVLGYCLAGAALLALAAWLDSLRDLEKAGEPIVYPAVRAALKYLAGISLGLFFAACTCLFAFEDAIAGPSLDTPAAIALAVLAALGAALGLVFAEMAMSRSTRVLGRCWKGAVALACVSVLLVGACHTDALGIASKVPDPATVESVELDVLGNTGTFTSDEAKEAIAGIHADLIAYGGEKPDPADAASQGQGEDTVEVFGSQYGTDYISLTYHLADGSTLARQYPMPYSFDGDGRPFYTDEALAIVRDAGELINSEESLLSRYGELFATAGAGCAFVIEAWGQGDSTYRIPASRTADFVENALKPDILENHASDWTPYWNRLEEENSDTALEASLYAERPDGNVNLWLSLDTKRTPLIIEWCKANLPSADPAIWVPRPTEG